MTINEDENVVQRPARPRCFLDIAIGKDSTTLKSDDQIYRIIIELYADICPLTCENFRCLCTGERGLGLNEKMLSYKDCPFHRIIKNFMIQGGDIIQGNGKSGESIYGRTFQDENFEIKHDRPYIMSMANKGKDTNSSQFFITTVPAPHLDGKHVAFGQVISGQSAISLIENLPTDETGKPALPVMIVKCGELVLQLRPKKLPEENENILKDFSLGEEGLFNEVISKNESNETLLTQEDLKNHNLPPEIPRNFLSRTMGPELIHGTLIPSKFNNFDEESSNTRNMLLSTINNTNEERVKALRDMLSSHVPNLKELLSTEDGDNKRDAMSKMERREERSRRDRSSPHHGTHRSSSRQRYRDRYPDHRSNRNDSRPNKRRIPTHILHLVRDAQRSPQDRKRSRSATPPHWKEAQRRLVKLEDVIIEEQRKLKTKPEKDRKLDDHDDDNKAEHKITKLKSDSTRHIKREIDSNAASDINPRSEEMAKAFWGPEGKPPPLPSQLGKFEEKGPLSEKDWERAKLAAQMAHEELTSGTAGLYAGPGVNDLMKYTKPVIPDPAKYKDVSDKRYHRYDDKNNSKHAQNHGHHSHHSTALKDKKSVDDRRQEPFPSYKNLVKGDRNIEEAKISTKTKQDDSHKRVKTNEHKEQHKKHLHKREGAHRATTHNYNDKDQRPASGRKGKVDVTNHSKERPSRHHHQNVKPRRKSKENDKPATSKSPESRRERDKKHSKHHQIKDSKLHQSNPSSTTLINFKLGETAKA